MPNFSRLATNTAFNTKIREAEKKYQIGVTNTTFSTKIGYVEKNILFMLNILLQIILINLQMQYLTKD